MVIIGLDPGTQKFGYALLKVNNPGNQLSYLHSGVINLSKITCHWEKLRIIHQKAIDVKNEFAPDEVAMEAMIYHKNPQTLIKLTQAKIAFCSAYFITHEKKIFEYLPNVVKKANTGFGHVAKSVLAARFSKGMTSITPDKKFESLDESDALAVAFCHFQYKGLK